MTEPDEALGALPAEGEPETFLGVMSDPLWLSDEVEEEETEGEPKHPAAASANPISKGLSPQRATSVPGAKVDSSTILHPPRFTTL